MNPCEFVLDAPALHDFQPFQKFNEGEEEEQAPRNVQALRPSLSRDLLDVAGLQRSPQICVDSISHP